LRGGNQPICAPFSTICAMLLMSCGLRV
jgi:hypothetical protein